MVFLHSPGFHMFSCLGTLGSRSLCLFDHVLNITWPHHSFTPDPRPKLQTLSFSHYFLVISGDLRLALLRELKMTAFLFRAQHYRYICNDNISAKDFPFSLSNKILLEIAQYPRRPLFMASSNIKHIPILVFSLCVSLMKSPLLALHFLPSPR